MAMRASLDARPADGDSMVSFALGGRRFAVPGAQVAEIANVSAVIGVPAEDPTVLGVILHRDQLIALVDLARRLGARSGTAGPPPWLCLFARTEQGMVAFPVDRVLAFGAAGGARLPDDVEIVDLERV